MTRQPGGNPVHLSRGRILLIASALILSTVMARLDPGFVPTAAASADSNSQFDQYCIGCHGPDGRGITNLGVDLVASAFVASKSESALVEFLKAGRLPDDSASKTGRPMPGFAWVPEGELKSVAAFVKARSAAK